jgi:hypothetical protein
MDIQKKELWDRLENEPERAYRDFESFLSLPSGARTLLEAYRRHVGNPDAAKPSDTWSGWASTFAWRERAAAYDDHLASVRRGAYQRAVEEEAARQAREVEKVRGRYNELMTLVAERAIESLEDEDWVCRNLRASDVVQIIRLHLDAEKAFGLREPRIEDDWTVEDEAEMDDIIDRIDALPEDDEFGDDKGNHPKSGDEPPMND